MDMLTQIISKMVVPGLTNGLLGKEQEIKQELGIQIGLTLIINGRTEKLLRWVVILTQQLLIWSLQLSKV